MDGVDEVGPASRTAVLRERYRSRPPPTGRWPSRACRRYSLRRPERSRLGGIRTARGPEGYVLLFFAAIGALRTPVFNPRAAR
jgi:hypothetical protein